MRYNAVVPERTGVQAHGRGGSLSLEGALVLLLYVSLLTDLYVAAKGRYSRSKKDNSNRRGRLLIPTVGYRGHNSCNVCREKKSIRSLDTLWRQMQIATNQIRLINMKHHVITKVMMEARIEAREKERERLLQKREQMLAGGSLTTPSKKKLASRNSAGF